MCVFNFYMQDINLEEFRPYLNSFKIIQAKLKLLLINLYNTKCTQLIRLMYLLYKNAILKIKIREKLGCIKLLIICIKRQRFFFIVRILAWWIWLKLLIFYLLDEYLWIFRVIFNEIMNLVYIDDRDLIWFILFYISHQRCNF